MVLINVVGVENTRYGVEIGVGVENVGLSKPMNKWLRALHSHGLQIPRNWNMFKNAPILIGITISATYLLL